jgi:ketosteroid isomerase-like protein
MRPGRALAVLTALAALWPPLSAWAVRLLLQRNLERLRAGDYKPILRFDSDDVRLRFPGDSSWAGEFHGKAQLEPWLQRFVRVGLQIYADEIVVTGPPWNTTLCMRGHDHLTSPDGETVYENRYVIWGRVAWGLLRDYEVYEDTQKSAALDDYLAVRERAAG